MIPVWLGRRKANLFRCKSYGKHVWVFGTEGYIKAHPWKSAKVGISNMCCWSSINIDRWSKDEVWHSLWSRNGGSPVALLKPSPVHLLHVLISTQPSLYDQIETTFTVYQQNTHRRTECFGRNISWYPPCIHGHVWYLSKNSPKMAFVTGAFNYHVSVSFLNSMVLRTR